MGYLIAGYAVVLGGVAGYALHLLRERRELQREIRRARTPDGG